VRDIAYPTHGQVIEALVANRRRAIPAQRRPRPGRQ
jgi:hypothetical protein